MDRTTSIWKHLSNAFALTVAVMMVIGLIAMVFNINIVPWLLSGALFLVIFPVAFLVVSLLSKRKGQS